MPRITPVDLEASEEAKNDIKWLALQPDVLKEQIIETGAEVTLLEFRNRWNALMETELEDSVTSFTKSNNYKGPGDTNSEPN